MASLGFAVWWIVLFLLHGVNIAYYVTAAKLYHDMRWTNVVFQLSTYSIGINATEYGKVSAIHGVIAALHALFLAIMVLGSVQAQRLAFRLFAPRWLTRVTRWFAVRVIDKAGSRSASRSLVTRSLSSVNGASRALGDSIFGRRGLLGVDSVHFDHLHVVRELIETALQAVQAYRMSYFLPRVWFIRVYVALLITNCWCTPLVHRYYRDRHAMRRLMSLLCDAVLDMVASIGVSLWIFASYLPQYTDPYAGFPFLAWFDDVWFTNMQQEFQMMMVVSWGDMASRLVFALGLLVCMESIKDILKCGDLTLAHAEVAPKTVETTAVVPYTAATESARGPTKHLTKPTRQWSHFTAFLIHKAAPMVFVAFGFAILVVHIVSETGSSTADVPCQLRLHPWPLGFAAVDGKAWNTFEYSATARIVIRHCPQLELPPTIQEYHEITSVKLYNCTIVSWSAAAAFTSTAHPNMRTLYTLRTEFPHGELPLGIRTSDFPKGLTTLVTSTTNLRTLPDDVYAAWPQGMTLAFELSQLQRVSPAFFRVNASVLSFAGSPISAVPAEVFETPGLTGVMLSYTPIQELPRVVTAPSPALYFLLLEGTNVSTFWSWMDPFAHLSAVMNRRLFNAHGSRYCTERDAIVAGNRTSFSIAPAAPNAKDLSSVMDVSTPAALQFALSAVACEAGFPFFFAIGLQDAILGM